MPWLRFLLVLTCFLICSMRAHAAPAPIVFDFEDGLQGWELHGSATRVQTQILGGEWAIFGDGLIEGGASMSIVRDVTNIASISVEQFFSGNAPLQTLGTSFLSIDVDNHFALGIAGTLLSQSTANPGTRVFDLRGLGGNYIIEFLWGSIGSTICFPGPCPPPFLPTPEHSLGFIDNITFHPVPEPSSWFLLSLGIAGMVMIRRKVAARARS